MKRKKKKEKNEKSPRITCVVVALKQQKINVVALIPFYIYENLNCESIEKRERTQYYLIRPNNLHLLRKLLMVTSSL